MNKFLKILLGVFMLWLILAIVILIIAGWKAVEYFTLAVFFGVMATVCVVVAIEILVDSD